MSGSSHPGYLRWRLAVERLASGMWTGTPVPETVRKIRRREPRLRVKHGARRIEAGKLLVAASKRGGLTAYSVPDPELIGRSRSSIRGGPRIVALPRGVLDSLVMSRGTLPDHAHRPSLRMCGGDKQLLFALETGFLAVKKTEFEAWYRAERRRGKWPSQRSQTKRPLKGRPAKETAALRNAITNLTLESRWSAKAGLNALHRLLKAERAEVPNSATLGRIVDRLWNETGEVQFRRAKRHRRQTPSPDKQKSTR
jgi:hypothetical protein